MIQAPRQPRQVSQGAHGRDIVAYKGGLLHAGLRHKGDSNSPTFGHKMRSQVIKFQSARKLKADGVIGPQTYTALVHFIGDYGRRLLKSLDMKLEAQTAQARVVQNALWSCQSFLQPYWVYREVRPIPYWIPTRDVGPGKHTAETDCSGFTGLIAKWSGAPSPFPSFGFDGSGNTDTMVAELPRVDMPAPGDLILYDNPGHVVISVDYPWAVSFGSEPGPIKIDSRYRQASHFRRFLG